MSKHKRDADKEAKLNYAVTLVKETSKTFSEISSITGLLDPAQQLLDADLLTEEEVRDHRKHSRGA
jgi:hypothetical protein